MKGICSKLSLDNGKFRMVSGIEKSKDSIWFYCTYDLFRIYLSDFGGKFSSYLQKPVSFIFQHKTIIFGKLQSGLKKYVPGVTAKSIDFGYLTNIEQRKDYVFLIEYQSVQEDNSTTTEVIFV